MRSASQNIESARQAKAGLELCNWCGIYEGKHLRQPVNTDEILNVCHYCNGENHPTHPERHKPHLYE